VLSLYPLYLTSIWIRSTILLGTMSMELPFFASLAQLRAAIGFLGEREQNGWWQSTFLSAGSRPFLAPVFGRTLVLAQCAGVTQAAALVHDGRIGVGRVFNLFGLPEDVEQGIHRVLRDTKVGQQIAPIVASPEAALAYLQSEVRSAVGSRVGPTQVGSAHDLRERKPRCTPTLLSAYDRCYGERVHRTAPGRPRPD